MLHTTLRLWWRQTTCFLGLCLTVNLVACGPDTDTGTKAGRKGGEVPDFHYSSADIISPPTPASTNLPADIYLDATLSMKGFAQPQNTNFSQLLEDLESAVQNVTKRADTRFFKYGKSVAPLKRADFVAARHNQALWENKGFASETDFAQAVDSTDPGRVSIFITDLFYSNADANKVVAAISEKCFRSGVEMGLMGLKSAFDGYVCDVQPCVKVTGDRPLYLVVFGSKTNINLIFSAFRNQTYAQANQMLLLTRYPVKNFTVTATKDKDSKAINISSARKQFTDASNVFAFGWNPDKGNTANVNYTITNEPEPYALPISAENLKAQIFRKDGGKVDSVADEQSIQLRNVSVAPDKIAGQAQVNLKLPEKSHVAYQLTWQYDNLGRVTLPGWVTANSTQDFRQGNDENKTLGLDNFVRSLAVSAATQFEPQYGKLYLVFVRK